MGLDNIPQPKRNPDGMRSTILQVKGVESPITCKIQTEVQLGDSRPDSFIFLYLQDSRKRSGYITFSQRAFEQTLNHLVALTDNPEFFREGDIFLLEPSGVCTLLYESRSEKNAIFLTAECNSRCILCPQPPIKSGSYLVHALELLDLVDEDINTLGITGGEPTVVWEDLLTLLNICHRKLPNTAIQILTNARILADLARVKELSGSNNMIMACITLYSDIDSTHDTLAGAKGAFWETLKGMYNLAKLNIPIELRTVINRYNFQRLPAFAEFIYNYLPFCRRIALMGIEPIGMARKNLSRLWIDPIDYLVNLEEAVKILHRRNCNVAVYNHQLCTLSPFLANFAAKAISEWKTVFKHECFNCAVMKDCGGFFESAGDCHSRAIRAL